MWPLKVEVMKRLLDYFVVWNVDGDGQAFWGLKIVLLVLNERSIVKNMVNYDNFYLFFVEY